MTSLVMVRFLSLLLGFHTSVQYENLKLLGLCLFVSLSCYPSQRSALASYLVTLGQEEKQLDDGEDFENLFTVLRSSS